MVGVEEEKNCYDVFRLSASEGTSWGQEGSRFKELLSTGKGSTVFKENQEGLTRMMTSPKRINEYAVTDFSVGTERTTGLRGERTSKEL